jgi:DNA-binding transcriptional regulator PaaX
MSKKRAKRSRRNLILGIIDACFERLAAIDSYFANPYQVAEDLIPYSSYRVQLSRLKQKRLIRVKVDEAGDRWLELVSAGGEVGSERSLTSLCQRDWDGYWRVVVFDVPEESRKKRDFIRRKLRELGFGQFQRSVWISLLPVKKEIMEFLSSAGVGGRAIIFETQDFWAGDVKGLIRRVWGLKEREKRWKEWIKAASKIVRKNTRKGRREAKQEFWQLILEEPLLPRDVLSYEKELKKASFLYTRLSQ